MFRLYNNYIIHIVCLRLSVFPHNFTVTTLSHTMELVCAVISFFSSLRNANLMFDMPHFESLRRESIAIQTIFDSRVLYINI